MAEKKTAAKKTATKTEATLEFDDGYWFIVEGDRRTNVGRSRRYADLMLARYK